MPYELLEDIPSSPAKVQPQAAAETIPQTLGRGLARTASRAVESVVGLPGDIASGLLNLTNLGISKATGKPSPLPAEQHILPQSENVREAIQNIVEKPFLPQDYLSPQNRSEEFIDNIISDAIPLLIPLKGKMPFGKALKHAGLVSTGSNAIQQGAKELGLSEGQQQIAKATSMLGLSLVGPANINNYMKRLYKTATDSIPEGAVIAEESLQPALKKLNSLDVKGYLTPQMEKRIANFKDSIKNGKASVEDVWQMKRDINEWIGSDAISNNAKKALPTVTRDLVDSLEQYGAKNKPFLNTFKEADNIYAGLNQASMANEFLQKHVNQKNLNYIIGSVLFGFKPSAALGTAAGLYGTREGLKFLESLKNSSAVRNYYLKTLGAAQAKNAKETKAFAHKLNNAFEKYEGGRYELIED